MLIIGSVLAGGAACRSCYRHHVVSYPVNEQVEIVISNGHKLLRSYVNVPSNFQTGFPDSTGSLDATLWPVQFKLPSGKILYATIDALLLAPDKYVERQQVITGGVERRNIAISRYLDKKIQLCKHWNSYYKDYSFCPSFFTFKKRSDLNSIILIDRHDINKLAGDKWYFKSVSITLNHKKTFMPALSEFPALTGDHKTVARKITGQVSQKELCLSFKRGENPFCRELEN